MIIWLTMPTNAQNKKKVRHPYIGYACGLFILVLTNHRIDINPNIISETWQGIFALLFAFIGCIDTFYSFKNKTARYRFVLCLFLGLVAIIVFIVMIRI